MKRKSLLLIIIFCISFQQNYYSKNNNKPKNIIIMIGDGMGLSAISAVLISNPDNIFTKFKSLGISITCSADKLITDSAAGATAFSCGYKTNNGYLGVSPANKPLQTIFEKVEQEGYLTGLVVTSTITHATPAAFYAHINNRADEADIAVDLLKSGVDIIIGGGLKYFLPSEDSGKSAAGNLIQSFKQKKYSFYKDFTQLKSSGTHEKLIALINDDAIKPAAERNYSLGELTSIALKDLSENKKGFMLMVEGSQIDWGAHDNNKSRVVSELNDFQGAIKVALDFAEKDGNTLVIVTADHETGGVSIMGNKRDIDSINFNFASKGHTAACVGIFAKGPGEGQFTGVMENYMIGRKLFAFYDPKKKW